MVVEESEAFSDVLGVFWGFLMSSGGFSWAFSSYEQFFKFQRRFLLLYGCSETIWGIVMGSDWKVFQVFSFIHWCSWWGLWGISELFFMVLEASQTFMNIFRCSGMFSWDWVVLKFPGGFEVFCDMLRVSEAFGFVVDIMECSDSFWTAHWGFC